MLIRLLGVETRKLLKHPIVWVELAALLGLLALFFTARYAALARGLGGAPLGVGGTQTDMQSGLAVYRFIGVLFYASLAALIAADDMRERGIQMWLLHGVGRPALMLVRLLLGLACGWLLTMLAAFGSIVEGALARIVLAGGQPGLPGDWTSLPDVTAAIFMGAVPYMALTFLLAIASRSAITGAGGVLVFRMVLENLLLHLGDRAPALVRLLPVQLAGALERAAPGAGAVEMAAPALYLGAQDASLVIAAMACAFGALSIMLFRRQDWGG